MQCAVIVLFYAIWWVHTPPSQPVVVKYQPREYMNKDSAIIAFSELYEFDDIYFICFQHTCPVLWNEHGLIHC